MSSRHAIHFKPEPVKPIRYRTHRTWWRRLQPLVAGLAVAGAGAAIVLAVSAAIGRMYATDAQLDAAFLAGMATGQTMCGGR